jgi:hypothetical protein
MATYTLIDSEVLTSSAASVTFSSIPADYTDLVVRFSGRSNLSNTQDDLKLTFNGSTSTYSGINVQGNGSAAASNTLTGYAYLYMRNVFDAATATANTFSSVEIYIPNYTSSVAKPFNITAMQENNTTAAQMATQACLWSGTSAITSMTIAPVDGTAIVSGSSFYLYGISNA